MPKPAKLSAEFVKECFTYNPETGELLWRNRPRNHFRSDKDHEAWNRRYPGSVPGYIRDDKGRNRCRTVVISHPSWGDFRAYDCNRACAILLGYDVTDETMVSTKNGDMNDLRGENIWVIQPDVVPGRLASISLQEYLNECFTADVESGELRWNLRPRDHFQTFNAWNSFCKSKIGRRAESRSLAGYLIIKLQKSRFIPNSSMPAHRALWTMVHGDIPTGMVIDHINGEPSDNRISNLRLVTKGENCLNRRNKKRSSGLPKNINKISGGYSVSFGVNSGRYDTLDEATEASLAASLRWFGTFSREHGGIESKYDGDPLAIKVKKFLSGEIDEIIHKKKAPPIAE